MLSISTYFMVEELKKRGYVLEFFDSEYMVRASRGTDQFFLFGSKGPQISAGSHLLCTDKYLSRQVMERDHFAIPKYAKVDRNTLNRLRDWQFPVVIKPITLSGGRDVVVGVQSIEEVQVYLHNHPHYVSVLVEEMLEGNDTRVLIVHGKFFAAVQRVPPTVIGDGVHTIQQLVDLENQRRQEVFAQDTKEGIYTTDLRPITFDAQAIRVITDYGYLPTTILNVGDRLLVRKNANVSTGGTSLDVTDQVCEEIRQECERLAKSFGISVVGVDIMTKDLSVPLNGKEKSGIVEVNSSPGLDLHILTDEGQRRNPVPLIVDEIEEYLEKNG